MPESQRTSWKQLVPWVLIAGTLGATAVELALFGASDVTDALTYAGRIGGVVLLTAAILEVVAVGALFNLARPRPAKYSGALVVVGLLICVLTNVVLLVLHLDGAFTPYAFFLILLPCSCWALLRLYRAGVWSSIPHPKGFAAGVGLAGVLAVANFMYTQVYQPYTAKALVATTVEFGTPTVRPNGSVSLPLRLRTRNTGDVAVYVLGSLYQVSARPSWYVSRPRQDRDWLQDLNTGQRDLLCYTDIPPYGHELLAQGSFVGRSGPAPTLEPGADIVTHKIVEFPKERAYEVLTATANVAYLRKDRAKLIDDYTRSGASSWDKEFRYGSAAKAPEWITGGSPVNTFRFQSRIEHSTAVLEHTRAQHYVTLWWVLHEVVSESPFGPDLVAVVGTREALERRPTASETHRMKERYGLAYAASGTHQRSLSELQKPPAKP
ncbi:hypothetical protein ACIGO8_27485 [Streptomyces sp. NPDC053493]|uniref:hypothetical protein n=1 Tax=Streptomyces sp. NPDC053493 TaxID=3365705 RepID=UPI0037CF4BC3